MSSAPSSEMACRLHPTPSVIIRPLLHRLTEAAVQKADRTLTFNARYMQTVSSAEIYFVLNILLILSKFALTNATYIRFACSV